MAVELDLLIQEAILLCPGRTGLHLTEVVGLAFGKRPLEQVELSPRYLIHLW